MADPLQPASPVLPPPAMEDVDNTSPVPNSPWAMWQQAQADLIASQSKTVGTKSVDYAAAIGRQASEIGSAALQYLRAPVDTMKKLETQVGDAQPLNEPRTTPPTQDLQDAYKEAERFPGATEVQQGLAEQRLGTKPGMEGVLTPVEEFRKEYEPNPIGDIVYYSDPWDWVRRGAWYAAEGVGQYLPKPGTRTGDLLERYTGEYTANMLEATLNGKSMIWGANPHRAGFQALSDEEDRELEAVGQNLYRAITSGELFAKAKAERSEEYGIPFVELENEPKFTTPIPRGVHILDSAVPVELANRLMANAVTHGRDDEATFWAGMTTHLGREVVGATMEMAADPMWAMGPAAGAKIVHHGGRAFEMAEPILRAAAAMENSAGIPGAIAKNTLIDLVHGDAAAQTAAKARIEASMSDLSREYVEATGRLNVELAKDIPDAAAVARLKSEADVAAMRYDSLERATTLLRAGEENGFLRPRGIGAMHVPGSDKTFFLSDIVSETKYGKALVAETSAAKGAVLDTLNNRLAKYSSDNIIQKAAENVQAGRYRTAGMTGGEKLAYAAHLAGGKAEDFRRITWDALAKTFGSRFVEPLIHTATSADTSLPGASVEGAWRMVAGTPYQRITGQNAESFRKAQDATTGLLTKMHARKDILERRILNIVKASNIAHGHQLRMKRNGAELKRVTGRLTEIRERMAKAIPYEEQRKLQSEAWELERRQAEIEHWDTGAHTPESVMNEAFDLAMRGAGKDFDPAIASAVDEWRKFLHEAMKGTEKERVEISNMMAAVGRIGVGDPDAAAAIKTQLRRLDDLGINGDFERLQLLADARLHAVGGMKSILNDLDPQSLATVLERILKLGGPVTNQRDAIQSILADIFGDARMVDDLAGRATVITGEKNPWDAVMVLANMVRQAGKGGDDLASTITQMAKEWREEELLLRRLSMGEWTPELKKAASSSAMAAAIQRRIAQLRGKIGGDDWEKFLDWVASPDHDRVTVPAWEPYVERWHRIQAMALAAADARGSTGPQLYGILSDLKARLTDTGIAQERMRRSLGIVDSKELQTTIRKALGRVLDVEQPVIAKLADDIAEQMVETAVRREPLDAALMVGEAARRGEMDTLEKKLASVRPRFEYPDGTWASMDDMETEVFREFRRITEGMDEEQKLYVAMSALVHGPKIPGIDWKHIAKLYGGVFGTRFPEVPPEMEQAVAMVRALVKTYEDMYVRHGMSTIIKSPARLMREEGVAEYAPKIMVSKQDVAGARSSLKRADSTDVWAPGDLDMKFSTTMDAAKRRKSIGTVEELRSFMDSADPNTYSYKPAFLMARYMQANRAVSAGEYLDELIQLGVARTFDGSDDFARTTNAAMADHVPLFRAGKEVDGAKFAGWMVDLPEVRAAYKIDNLINSLPEAEKVLVADLAVKGQFEDVLARLQAVAGEGVKLEQVEKYFGKDSPMRLYVPRSLHQSMLDLFMVAEHGGAYRAWRDAQQWLKPWFTMVNLAYHSTNAIGNTLNNILDLGMFGAFNAKTLAMASRLHAASTVADQWGGGSLKRALERIEGRGRGMVVGKVDEVLTETEFAAARAYSEAYGLERAAKEGLDLGDGLLRDCDDALRIVRENGVSQLSFYQATDMAAEEARMADDMLGGKLRLPKRIAKAAGDVLMVAAPSLMANSVMMPTAVGFSMGEVIGRTIENQARLVNFIAHMRQTGSIADSAASVQRVLFNYQDLTSIQREYLRMVFPFVTWPLKNVQLHFERMTRNPAFYAVQSRLMFHTLPRLAQASESDNSGSYYFPTSPYDERAGLQYYGWSQYRVPIPESWGGGRDVTMSGIQTPYEGMVDSLATARAIGDCRDILQKAYRNGGPSECMRVVGQMSWMLQWVGDLAYSRSLVTGQPIGEMTKAEDIRAMRQLFSSVPLVGPALARNLEQASGYFEIDVVDPATGVVMKYPQADQLANWAMSRGPLSRILNEAIAMTGNEIKFTAAELLNETTMDPYGEAYTPGVSPGWHAVESMLGPAVDVEAPETRVRRMEQAVEKAVKAEAEAYGALKTVPITSIAQ